MKKALFIMLGIYFFVIACTDTEIIDPTKGVSNTTPTTTPPTNSAKLDLIAKTWKFDEMLISDGSKSGTIYKAGVQTSVIDLSSDSFVFEKTGKFTHIESGKKNEGTWKFLNNETQIQTSAAGQTVTFDIVSLSSTKLELKQSVEAKTATPSELVVITLIAPSLGLSATAKTYTYTIRLSPK